MRRIALCLALLSVTGTLAMAQNAVDFVEEGRASWSVLGGGTLQAAHPSLPIGSTPTVRNLASGREVVVTVTGRIPASTERVIDLSGDAAQAIGLDYGSPVRVFFPPPPNNQTGTVEGSAQGINITVYNHVIPASALPGWLDSQGLAGVGFSNQLPSDMSVTPALPDPNSGLSYRLMVGNWPDVDSAVLAFLRLRDAGFFASQEYAPSTYRVFANSVPANEVLAAVRRLGANGFKSIHIEEQRTY
ncbi:MAG: septal ring lytic transglycosylase RlpA family protein [Treponema sp.]|nr:septal ring lytic transglycosylase RlpA family protein [Treponema sp.]